MDIMQTENINATTKLFIEYLDTCNTAIRRHDDEFPYKQLISLADDKLGDKEIGVAVYADDPDSPHDFFTIEMKDGAFHFLEHGKNAPDIAWRTPRQHLQQVVDNPDRYIDNPSKLDLDWIKARVGLS